ncbi:MAG: SUMF1/EgtB/PvdO family nonheme iron enzyme [Thermodesulfobacteriota bacterium]
MDGRTPKITDFGLAGGQKWPRLTRSHHAFGTIYYMAPEQFTEMDRTDARADVYALGKILYEAVIGRLDKNTAKPFQTVGLNRADTPLLVGLDRIIGQATAANPAERIASVGELQRSLTGLLESLAAAEKPGRRPSRRLVYLLATLVLLLAVPAAWRHFQPVPPAFRTAQPPEENSHLEETPLPPSPAPGTSFTGRDGARLRYVPGGEMTLDLGRGDQPPKPVTMPPLYMDETEVTNHQYVEFLNRNLDRLTVENGVVRAGERIWLLLGEVVPDYEPIVFHQGRFALGSPDLASHPVVRVTAYGAEAYAIFYGRRLPTVSEWYHAAQVRHVEGPPSEIEDQTKDKVPQGAPPETQAFSEPPHPDMHPGAAARPAPGAPLAPVGLSPANSFGLKGLEGNAAEWTGPPPGEPDRAGYYILGGLDLPEGDPTARAIGRQPWEAFAKVGFRTVLPPAEKGP